MTLENGQTIYVNLQNLINSNNKLNQKTAIEKNLSPFLTKNPR